METGKIGKTNVSSSSAKVRFDPQGVSATLAHRLTMGLITVSALFTYDWFCRGQMAYGGVGLVCTLLLTQGHKRLGKPYPLLSLWLAIWFSAHLTGMYFGLYETSATFDKAMHVIITSGFAMMWIDWAEPAVDRSMVDPIGRIAGTVLLALTFTLSSAALWEIFEFVIDQTGLFTAQRSLEDTMLDMIAALAGGTLALTCRMLIGLRNS